MKQRYLDKAIERCTDRTPIGVLEILAEKMKRLDTAQTKLDDEGLVVRDMKGSVIEHPALKIVKDVEKEILTLFTAYGKRA